jgi:hypothetical protein
MRGLTVTHSSSLLVAFVSVLSLAACGGSSPAPAQKATTPAQTVAPPSAPLTGATSAPGSELFNPDQHPELAQLTEVTTASLEQGIKTYVQSETARQGGVFPVEDPEQHTTLPLTLTTVHRERLSQLADGRYFACADFKGRDGHTYDVDVFMRRESTGLTPTDVIVHKQDGKARFNWVEQNGIWSQVPVATP